MKKEKGKNAYVEQGLLLMIICGSLVGCVSPPATTQTPCVASPPVLEETIDTGIGFFIPRDEMGQITAYIEALRQCVDVKEQYD